MVTGGCLVPVHGLPPCCCFPAVWPWGYPTASEISRSLHCYGGIRWFLAHLEQCPWISVKPHLECKTCAILFNIPMQMCIRYWYMRAFLCAHTSVRIILTSCSWSKSSQAKMHNYKTRSPTISLLPRYEEMGIRICTPSSIRDFFTKWSLMRCSSALMFHDFRIKKRGTGGSMIQIDKKMLAINTRWRAAKFPP